MKVIHAIKIFWAPSLPGYCEILPTHPADWILALAQDWFHTSELQKHSYKINLYDPYFENHPEVLEETYDFIICCEVMEHFHQPFE